jgi:hypothetical protein
MRPAGVSRILMALAIGFCAHSLAAQKHAEPESPVESRNLVSHFPEKPSRTPTLKIPLDPLGFATPGSIYLGARNALVSLDFLDEDHLLFSFRVPGLIHRESKDGVHGDERRIRAVVLALPEGSVEAEALWTVHDRLRYVWPLKDGHFLLRDGKAILQGDATLALKPYLDFPGPVEAIELDPAQQYLVTNSEEPKKARDASSSAEQKPSLSGPSTAMPTGTSDQDSEAANDPPDNVVRVLRLGTGEVMLASRAATAVHVPINSTGYVENLRSRGQDWALNFHYFSGGTRTIGTVPSSCDPDDSFLSENVILIQGCSDEGASRLTGMTIEGRTLWIAQAPDTQVWPQLTVAANGSRFGWITLDTIKPLDTFEPMASENVKEQSVTIFDAATGDIPLVSPLTPILDVGGNVAISPSGRRVALIHDGAIQLFDLPPAPAVPKQK